jgi:hypothetical protein
MKSVQSSAIQIYNTDSQTPVSARPSNLSSSTFFNAENN